MPKQKVVIFEGVDKSGKTTLKDHFNRQTNYKYWVLDRSFVSSLVYSKLFERNDEEYWMNVAKDFCSTYDVYFVYCHSSEQVVRQRLEHANETLPEKLQNIVEVCKLFIKYLDEIHARYLTINTEDNIDVCTANIKQFLEDK